MNAYQLVAETMSYDMAEALLSQGVPLNKVYATVIAAMDILLEDEDAPPSSAPENPTVVH